MAKPVDFVTLLERVQQYISERYAAALADKEKSAQLRSYIEKYIFDYGVVVEGMPFQILSDKLYCEMAEYSVLTQYLGQDEIEEIRSDDIIGAVRENIPYIKHPLKETFLAFTGDATAVSSNIKRALYNLKEKLDDEIFREWCDTLIACQDDRTLKDTLLPVVSKLTDVRIVNNELKGMLAAARNEYWVMVALVVGNIPLLYVLNKEWFHTLIYETSGKVVLGICGVVILVTALFMLKFTKPIEYKR